MRSGLWIFCECVSRPVDHESKTIVADAAISLAVITFELIRLNSTVADDSTVSTLSQDTVSGISNIANIGNVEEVDMLIRKALSIRQRVNGPNHPSRGHSLSLLSSALDLKEGDHDDEQQALLERL